MGTKVSGLMKFVGGTAFGATLGAAIGALMAPKSGDQMQAETNALINLAKTEGEAARVMAEERVAANFRSRVDDPKALKTAE